MKLKKFGIEKKGDTSVSRGCSEETGAERGFSLDPSLPRYFHKDGSTPGCLVGWRGRDVDGESLRRGLILHSQRSGVVSQPTAPIRSCHALPPSVCGLGYMGNVSGGRS